MNDETAARAEAIKETQPPPPPPPSGIGSQFLELQAQVEVSLSEASTEALNAEQAAVAANQKLDALMFDVHENVGWKYSRIAEATDLTKQDVGRRISRARNS